ncbi:Uncharacterized protein Rs2_09372 [Raphanus sativus]|nr:Uncharacterized protein Rs2_09372 [Raphanus sativus]
MRQWIVLSLSPFGDFAVQASQNGAPKFQNFVATGIFKDFKGTRYVFRLLCHGVNKDSTIGSQLGIAAASICANSPVLVESLTITFLLGFGNNHAEPLLDLIQEWMMQETEVSGL